MTAQKPRDDDQAAVRAVDRGSAPAPGRTSAIRARSRTTGIPSRAGSRRPATCGSPATPGRPALQARDLQGPRARRPQQPVTVFRRDGHLMVFFSPHSGHHLPPPGIRRAGCGTWSRCTGTRSREFGRVRTVPTNVPGGLGYTYPNPIQLKRQAVALLAWRRLESDLLLHRGRP